ncbi:MAG: transposase [Thermoguttaceae bacterium]|jgi:hypothetical protein
MFTDELRAEVWEDICQRDVRALAGKITPAVLAEAAKRTGVVLVKSPLCLGNLVWLGIACALHMSLDFACILTMTVKLLEDQQAFYSSELGKARRNGQRQERGKAGKTGKGKHGKSKHCPQRDDPTRLSEEAFVKARRRMPLAFWVNLIIILGEQFQEQHRSLLTFHGYRLLAVDGTCIDMANWKRLRDYFGTAKNARGRQSVQARMVMLQFPFTRLPYRYELCPLDEGEVTIARRLAQHLAKNDLVLLDACFWSYGLLCDIQMRGAFFALPIKGKRLNLKAVRNFGRQDKEVCWTPKDSRGQWRKEGLQGSINLRVITYQIPGFRAQKLATNLLDRAKISRDDWVRLAGDCTAEGRFQPGLCHRRWEIETTYRELKVEQGMNGNLRGRTPECIQYEVAGHVVLYLLVRWLMVEAAVKHAIDPLRLSFKNALRELFAMHSSLVIAQGRWVYVLLEKLLDRVAEHQVPYRPGRSYPRRKQSSNHKRKSKHPRRSRTTKAPQSRNRKPKAAKRQRAKSSKKG